MNAHDAWYSISAYIDGQLTLEEISRVRSHLDGCESCSREAESLRRTKSVTAALPRRDAPLSLLSELDRRYVRPSAGRRLLAALRLPKVWVPAGAAATALLFAAFWLGRSRSEELPLEALMAAHSRYTAEALVPHGDLVASNFSAQLAAYEAQQ
ncbi:MAG: zf-HC2 domain-containing protein [Elusimicrobia bacterium]|nr:zf-HC2 domain-containing protein [Elusimicrobiota bacterium]